MEERREEDKEDKERNEDRWNVTGLRNKDRNF